MATLKTDQVQDQLRALLDRLLGDDPAEYAEFETAPEGYLAKSGFDSIDREDVDACMPAKYDVPDETRARYDETHSHEPPATAGDGGGAGTWEVVREITMYRECLYPEAPYPEGDVMVDAGADGGLDDKPDEDRYDPDDGPLEKDDKAERLREEEAPEKERGEKPVDEEVVPDRYEQREEAEKLREEAIRKHEADEDLTSEEKALVDEYYDDPVEIDEEPPFTDREEQDIRMALGKVESGQELTPDEEALLARYQEAEGQEGAPVVPVLEVQGPPIDPEVLLAGRDAARKDAAGEELSQEEELLAGQYRDYMAGGQGSLPVVEAQPPFTDEEVQSFDEVALKVAAGEALRPEEEALLARFEEAGIEVDRPVPPDAVEAPPGYGPENDPGLAPELRDALAKADRGEDLTGDEVGYVKEYYEEQEQAQTAEVAAGNGVDEIKIDDPDRVPPMADQTNGEKEVGASSFGTGDQDPEPPASGYSDESAGIGTDEMGLDIDPAPEETVPGGMEEQATPMIEEVEPVGLSDGSETQPSSMEEEDDTGPMEG